MRRLMIPITIMIVCVFALCLLHLSAENEKTEVQAQPPDDIIKFLTDPKTVIEPPEGMLRELYKCSSHSDIYGEPTNDGAKFVYTTREAGKKKVLHILDIATGKDDVVIDINEPQFGKLDLFRWKWSPARDHFYLNLGFPGAGFSMFFEYDLAKNEIVDDNQGTFKRLASLDTIPEDLLKEGPDPRGDGPAWGLDGKGYTSNFDAEQEGVKMTVGPAYFRSLYQSSALST